MIDDKRPVVGHVTPLQGKPSPGELVRGDEKWITSEDVKKHYDHLKATSSLEVDISTLDHEKIADEENNYLKRVVPQWEAPPAPNGWLVRDRGAPITLYTNAQARLKVGLSCSYEDDGRPWIHFSLSHRQRIPTWGELTTTKDLFLGDREAFQILPPRKRWVSIHPNVLNLFALFDDNATPVLPDFTRGTGGI